MGVAALLHLPYDSLPDIEKQFRVKYDTKLTTGEHWKNVAMQEYDIVLRQLGLQYGVLSVQPTVFEVEMVEADDADSRPGASVLPIETTHGPQPGALRAMDSATDEFLRIVRPGRFARVAASDTGDSGNGSTSGSGKTDGNNASSSDDGDNGGTGSHNVDGGGTAGGSSSGNAGDDGSDSGDKNNRKPSPGKMDNDGDDISIITILDSEDELDDSSCCIIPEDGPTLPLGEEEMLYIETGGHYVDPLNQITIFEGSGIKISVSQNILARTKREKGKRTLNLPIKKSSGGNTTTTTTTTFYIVDNVGELPEVSSSDASEPELMSSLQLKRIITVHDFSSNAVWESRPGLGFSEVDPAPEYQTNEANALVPQPERSSFWNYTYPDESAPAATSSTSPDDRESAPSPVPATRQRIYEPHSRPSRPRPYPAPVSPTASPAAPPGSVIRLESRAERLRRICQRDRVTNLSLYDHAQGPSGQCAGSEDSRPMYYVPPSAGNGRVDSRPIYYVPPSAGNARSELTSPDRNGVRMPIPRRVHHPEIQDPNDNTDPIDLTKKND